MPNNQDEQQENIVEKQGKKLIRDKAVKVGKKIGKAAVKVAAKAILAAGKALISLLVWIGIPYLLLLGGIMVAVFMIYIATAMFFGGDPENLDEEGRGIQRYIIEAADKTVDMTRPEQIPYRVPPELLIAAAQIYDSGAIKTYNAITDLAEALRPIFEYETHKGETETITRTCTIDGGCTESTEITKYEVELLVRVDAWDRIVTTKVLSEKTPWETASRSGGTTEDGETITIDVRSQSDFFWTEDTILMDYTLYDRELSSKPFEYELESKLSVEAIYEITGGEIYYTEWLNGNSLAGFDGTIIPGSGIPLEYMQYYLEAEKKYGVDWYYLAAIHFTETGFSTHPTMLSSVGAEGHMQFMPCTWLGWNYPGCKGGLGGTSIPDSVKHDPAAIKKYGGYGVDADGDGKADPWNVKDAIFSTANYLSKSGFSSNIDKAIRNYNHSDVYVSNIKKKADEYKNTAQYVPDGGSVPNLAPGSFMRPANGRFSSPYGPRSLGSKSYHYGVDIANSANTPIVAAADGVVVKVHTGCPQQGHIESKCGGGWGNHVRIQHNVQGKIYEAVYAHFTKTAVSNGQPVQQGQLIGNMGMSGRVTGVHLHFELYNGMRNGYTNVLNPAQYIPL
ncbi:peptidoglycan DD-metalloendopeptidase family protein [Sporosarcina sp. FSL K6-1508]|uniref:peptidoglycan DD-metalloendopeptidase family protein n=1 Tax=Sporosarcina sp. FSL K6-1508 TaxID=2921553 RepID=UPI0030F5A6E2